MKFVLFLRDAVCYIKMYLYYLEKLCNGTSTFWWNSLFWCKRVSNLCIKVLYKRYHDGWVAFWNYAIVFFSTFYVQYYVRICKILHTSDVFIMLTAHKCSRVLYGCKSFLKKACELQMRNSFSSDAVLWISAQWGCHT